MKAEIIAVGNELLSGDTVNTNGAFLARGLTLAGFEVHKQTVVPDDADEIAAAAKLALTRSHVIVFTGGLGPTKDDLTKETVAKACGLGLVHSPEVEASIRSYFAQKNIEMTDNNLKQAEIIQSGEILQNDNGTAPGMFVQSRKQVVVLLPGPPSELIPMFENYLVPRLEKFAGLHAAHASLHVYGIGEGELETKVRDLLYGGNPTAALYAKTGQVHINLNATAPTEKEAQQLLKAKIAQFKERVGDCIYSENGEELHEIVVRLLSDANARIAVAESCTGGLLASRITAVNGASKIFEYGAATYSDRIKEKVLAIDSTLVRKYSSVSSVVAAEMARGALQKGKATIGVGITGIAGPTNEGYIDKPVGLVYIAVADKTKALVRKYNFGGMRSREHVRELSVLAALDMVRRFLVGLPIDDVRQFGAKDLADLTREGKPKKRSSIAVEKTVASVLCAMLVCTGMFFSVRAIRARIDRSVYSELQTTFAANAMSERLSALVEMNEDTVGWLSIDGETLDSVVVEERDDGFYDSHGFDGTQNALGCPHIVAGTDLTAPPQNIVIYGKPSDSSQLFASLRSYGEQQYVENSRVFQFDSVAESAQYKLVAVFLANSNAVLGDTQTFYKSSDFATAEELQEFVIQLKMRSVFNIDTDIRSTDRFLTLVIGVDEWTGSELVVVARRVRDGEAAATEKDVVSANVAALYPTVYYEKTGLSSVINETIERDKWLNWLAANDKEADQPEDAAVNAAGGGLSDESGISGTTVVDGQTAITVIVNGVEKSGAPVDIISGIVAAEMSESYSDEAIKAQAVATISWLKHSYTTTGAPSVTLASASDRVRTLVAGVIGECMYYNGEIAFTPYFAISSGVTKSSADVFGVDYPYLIPVESAYDKQVTGYTRTTTFSTSAVKSRIESTYRITLSSNAANWVVLQNGTSDAILIDDQVTTTGSELMKCLSLRSADFTVAVNSTQMVFTTQGSGHGVGMSKAGANEYAQELGWDYHQILEHYYPGIVFGEVTW